VTVGGAPDDLEFAASSAMLQLMGRSTAAEVSINHPPGKALATNMTAQHVAPIMRNGQRLDLYRVTVQYTALPNLYFGLIDVHGGTVRTEEERFEDLDRTPYVNTAGTLYNPPPKITKYNFTFTLVARQAKWNPSVTSSYLNQINFINWCGFSPRSVLFRDMRPRRVPYLPNLPAWAVKDRRYYYWEVAYEFEVNEAKWHPTRVIARGPAAKENASDTQAKPVRDGNQVYSGKPHLLKADGTLLSTTGRNIIPHYQEFRQHLECDFDKVFPWLKENPFDNS
jgi:hypothetical protein